MRPLSRRQRDDLARLGAGAHALVAARAAAAARAGRPAAALVLALLVGLVGLARAGLLLEHRPLRVEEVAARLVQPEVERDGRADARAVLCVVEQAAEHAARHDAAPAVADRDVLGRARGGLARGLVAR